MKNQLKEIEHVHLQLLFERAGHLQTKKQMALQQMGQLQKEIEDNQRALNAFTDTLRKQYGLSEKDSIDLATGAIARAPVEPTPN
jgi:hypothetical protein